MTIKEKQEVKEWIVFAIAVTFCITAMAVPFGYKVAEFINSKF